ncbi:MAG: hypothetical protein ABJO09_01035 [Hyphomicrobiales bacterium]
MAKQQYKLSTALREIIADLEATGFVTTSMLSYEVMNRHPELCDREKDRLFRDAIGQQARKMMKRETTVVLQSQLSLPLGPVEISRVPEHISLPPKNGDADMVWKTLEDSSFRELKAHTSVRTKQHTASGQALARLNRIVRMLEPVIPLEDMDTPLGKFLKMIDKDAA